MSDEKKMLPVKTYWYSEVIGVPLNYGVSIAMEPVLADSEKLKIAIEALKVYENVTRLTLDVRDLPEGYDCLDIADDGDTARAALKKLGVL